MSSALALAAPIREHILPDAVHSQDALRTRFTENQCKMPITAEYVKPLLRGLFCAFPLLSGLCRNGLLIRCWEFESPS